MTLPELFTRVIHALVLTWVLIAILIGGTVVVPLAAEILRSVMP